MCGVCVFFHLVSSKGLQPTLCQQSAKRRSSVVAVETNGVYLYVYRTSAVL